MQQRQPRLGDILDDYCTRERRLTNHAVVAMIGDDIRLTRCTTCDTEHDYKHARVPRLRKKDETAIASTLGVPVPKRIVQEVLAAVVNEVSHQAVHHSAPHPLVVTEPPALAPAAVSAVALPAVDPSDPPPPRIEEGPVHRQLIRAQLPRIDGQPPAVQRQAPDFTIRQPSGRQNRFRGLQAQRSGNGTLHHGSGDRSPGHGNGNVGSNGRNGGPRPTGRPPMPSRSAQHGPGRKRSK